MAVDAVTRYAQRVVGGKVPAGCLHRLACERHLRDMDSRASLGLVWAPKHLAALERVASQCHHFKGEWAGQPITFEPWQTFVLGSILSWRRAEDGLRRYRTSFVEVPRGQGKSTLAAVLAVTLTFFDGEHGASGYCVATKKDQARIVFDYARRMVLSSPALRRHIDAKQLYNIHSNATASKLEALGADADTLDGLRPHVAIADEVHRHPTSSVIDVMQTGMGTLRHPHLFEITTAGLRGENVWWSHREYSRQVLERVLSDETWFVFVAHADDDDDWTSEETWRKANPNYGVSVKPDYMAAQCRKATAMPGYQNAFRRLHLGQLVEQEHRYIDSTQWAACKRTDLDWEALRSQPCWGGLDLSTTTDLSAFVLVWQTDEGYVVRPWFWAPAGNADARERKDRVPYRRWAQSGQLTLTDGNVVDYDRIRADLNAIAQSHAIQSIGYDPWNATQLALQLTTDGLSMVQMRQGRKTLTEPTQKLAAAVAGGTLRHGGHDVLGWNIDNLVVSYDSAGNPAPDKGKATDRIDGAVALIMALGICITTGAKAEATPYVDVW